MPKWSICGVFWFIRLNEFSQIHNSIAFYCLPFWPYFLVSTQCTEWVGDGKHIRLHLTKQLVFGFLTDYNFITWVDFNNSFQYVKIDSIFFFFFFCFFFFFFFLFLCEEAINSFVVVILVFRIYETLSVSWELKKLLVFMA